MVSINCAREREREKVGRDRLMLIPASYWYGRPLFLLKLSVLGLQGKPSIFARGYPMDHHRGHARLLESVCLFILNFRG
jgi:hypothetical protein